MPSTYYLEGQLHILQYHWRNSKQNQVYKFLRIEIKNTLYPIPPYEYHQQASEHCIARYNLHPHMYNRTYIYVYIIQAL